MVSKTQGPLFATLDPGNTIPYICRTTILFFKVAVKKNIGILPLNLDLPIVDKILYVLYLFWRFTSVPLCQCYRINVGTVSVNEHVRTSFWSGLEGGFETVYNQTALVRMNPPL